MRWAATSKPEQGPRVDREGVRGLRGGSAASGKNGPPSLPSTQPQSRSTCFLRGSAQACEEEENEESEEEDDMKYFKPKLLARCRSLDDDIADAAAAQWDKAIVAYREHLRAIRPK